MVVFLYDLGGKVEFSPSGRKGGLLYHFWGLGHVCQNSLVNELRMRAEAMSTGRDNREVRRVREAYKNKCSQTNFKNWGHRATMSGTNLRVAEQPMVSWLL